MTAPDDSTSADTIDEVPDAELADKDVPIPESPHVARLRVSKGGPYYLAPDSAEPAPPGMWSKLDPDRIEVEVREVNRNLGDAFPPNEPTTDLPSEQREYLEAGGPAAHKLLDALSRGLDAASPDLLRGSH